MAWDTDRRPAQAAAQQDRRTGRITFPHAASKHSPLSTAMVVLAGPGLPGAHCTTVDAETMFRAGRRGEEIAKAVCAGCPAIMACLLLASELGHPDGVWAGMTQIERRALTR